MLVACILVNRTHWSQVEPVLMRLRARCNGARGLDRLNHDELIEIIRPLGFFNRRANILKRFAMSWVDSYMKVWPKSAEDVATLPGCGMYAIQSYQIFVLKEKPSEPVSDHKLAWYLENRWDDARQVGRSML